MTRWSCRRTWKAFPGLDYKADLVLLRFGYGAVRQAEPLRYASHCPGLGVESAQFLRDVFPACAPWEWTCLRCPASGTWTGR